MTFKEIIVMVVSIAGLVMAFITEDILICLVVFVFCIQCAWQSESRRRTNII